MPILTLALTSKTLPSGEGAGSRHAPGAEDLAAPGVGLVSISGGQKPAVRAGESHGAQFVRLTLEDLRVAIAQANVNQAKGVFDGSRRAYTIGANDQLLSSSDYSALIVASRNGAPVRLSDVADVIDSAENVSRRRG